MAFKSYKLKEISEYLGGKLIGGEPLEEISGINSLSEATSNELSFIYNKKFISDLKNTSALAVILSEEYKDDCPTTYILVKDVHLSYAKTTHLFSFDKEEYKNQKMIDSSAQIADDAFIGPNVYIGKNVIIEKGVIINSGTFIGNSSVIKEGTIIHSNVTIYHSVEIGKNNLIHASSVIGSDGLGFAKNKNDWMKIEHLGNVITEENVEIGAACTIDRASMGSTIISNGVKLDNQVHIAHNCCIGANTLIGAKTAVAGSTSIGSDCLIGGGCGIVDNIKITNKARINPMSFVTQSIKNPGIYSGGSILLDHAKWLRYMVAQKKKND